MTEVKKYLIQKLIDEAVQPFDPMTDEEFEELKLTVSKSLRNPISLSTDGFLFDGHQRCRALLALGRKYIDAKDVRIDTTVTRDDLWEAALDANLNRRNLTTEGKVHSMWRTRARGWTQARIAKKYGMTQSGVSRLMSEYGPPEGLILPKSIKGDDGKFYGLSEPEPNDPDDDDEPKAKFTGNPWSPEGPNFKAVHRAYKLLGMKWVTGMPDKPALTEYQWIELGKVLGQLQGQVQHRIKECSAEVTGVDPDDDADFEDGDDE